MNWRKKTLTSLLKDDRGQVLPWVTVMLICLLGVTSLVVDLGHAMVCYRELQAGTNAAALAGAQELPASDYTTVATNYSSATGKYNAVANNIPNVTTTVTGLCLTTVSGWGIPCSAPADENAVEVVQTVSIPTYFARVLGITTVNLSTTAVAAARGSVPLPYNVAIIVDSTASMNDTDSDSQCSSSRFACALGGVQTLLANMAPCSTTRSSCGAVTSGSNGAGNVSNGVDHVSLFTFPNATVGTISNDYGCSGVNPTIEPYVFPPAGATSYTPGTSPPSAGQTYTTSTSSSAVTYQVVGFSSDFKTSATNTTLNTGSNLVMSVGGKSGCTAMSAPGGDGTYYAGVIYAAQAALVAEQASYTSAKNIMILISDGDASEQQSGMGAPGNTSTSGTYPSYVGECQQAVTAAQAAAAAGTRIYAVAYGAESSGCTGEALTPCETMKGIASSSSYFYSDYTQSGSGNDSGCIGSADSTSNLNQIFTDIANSLTTSRLIPPGTT